MKKLLLIATLVATLGLTACNEAQAHGNGYYNNNNNTPWGWFNNNNGNGNGQGTGNGSFGFNFSGNANGNADNMWRTGNQYGNTYPNSPAPVHFVAPIVAAPEQK